MSLASAYDVAYIVTDAQAKRFKRNAIVVSVAWCFVVVSYVLFAVTAPYSFNYILNGSPRKVSPESAGLLSLQVSIQTACAIATQVIWGRGGGWWGRQKMLAAIALFVFLSQILGLVAHVTKTAELWIVGGVLTGISAAGFAQASSYCADMSTADNFAKTTGLLSAMGMFGSVLGFVTQAALGTKLLATLGVSCAFGFIALVTYTFLVPDVSPPLEKREQATAREIGLALLVCSAGKGFWEQTAYTKCLIGVMFFGGASFGAFRVWIFSFSIMHFGFGVQSLGVILLAFMFLGGVITLVGSRCLPVKAGTNFILWAQVLFALTCILGPAKQITLWIAGALGFGDALTASFINTMYFGQLSGKRRGELAAIKSLAEKLGNFLGVLVVTPINVLWITSFKTTGKGTPYTPPMVQLSFEVFAMVLYYLAQGCFRHQDKYGLFVLRTSEDVPDEHKAPHTAWDEEEGTVGR